MTSTYSMASAPLNQRLIQTIVNSKFCYCVRIETTHNTLKVEVAKKCCRFVSMNIFYSMWNWKTLFLTKVYRYLDLFSRHIVAIFETSVLKEVRILRILFPRCSANNGEVLIPKFQNKATVY